jgi:hypothetical protein
MSNEGSMATKGVSNLAHTAATDLGHLISQHFKIAQLEIGSEVRTLSRRVFTIAVFVVLLAIGYTTALIGGALAIGGYRAPGTSLLYLGLAHLLGAGLGLIFVSLRASSSAFMSNTSTEVDRSFVALKQATFPESIIQNSDKNAHVR